MKRFFTSRLYKCILQVIAVSCLFLVTPVKPNLNKPLRPSSHIIFIENSFGEALRQARIKNKYIFVDAYASWCGPCKMLKATTFNNEKAASFYNSNFINVSIDMEKGEGPALASQWQMQAYPTLIIFNPKGKAVLSTVGYINADILIKFGKQALRE